MLSCRPFLSPSCTPKWSRGSRGIPTRLLVETGFPQRLLLNPEAPVVLAFVCFCFVFSAGGRVASWAGDPAPRLPRWLAALIFRIWATHRPLWFSLWGAECHLSYSQLGIQAALVRKKMTVEHSLFAQIKQLVLDGEIRETCWPVVHLSRALPRA